MKIFMDEFLCKVKDAWEGGQKFYKTSIKLNLNVA